MNTQRNIQHRFKLTGTKVGDCFLGCPACFWQLNPGEATRPVCPECGCALRLYDVTKDDIPRGAKAR